MPVGMFFGTWGIMIGRTGPSTAIMNSCGVFLIILNVIFRSEIPTCIKIIGTSLVFIGVIISVLGSSVKKING